MFRFIPVGLFVRSCRACLLLCSFLRNRFRSMLLMSVFELLLILYRFVSFFSFGGMDITARIDGTDRGGTG